MAKGHRLKRMPRAIYPGWVLIKVDEKEEKTESGIYIPDVAKTDLTGTVVLVGETKDIKTFSSVGDRVLFNKSLFGIVEFEGQDYYHMREEGNVRMIL